MIHILGAGAIGGLWAIRLKRAGFSVCLIGRNSQSRTLTLHDGDSAISESFQVLAPHDVPFGDIKTLIVTTKTYDTLPALQALQYSLAPQAQIVLLQNGLGVREEVLAHLPRATVHSATTTDGVFRSSPDDLHLAGIGDTYFGHLDPTQTEQVAQAKQLCDQLSNAGLPIKWDNDIRARLWLKLAINCAINPLTVLFNFQNGELLKWPNSIELMARVCEEVTQLMRAEGLVYAQPLFDVASDVAKRTDGNTSSMLADIRAGRRTEIDYMNGFVLKRMRELELDAPVNEMLVERIKARESTST